MVYFNLGVSDDIYWMNKFITPFCHGFMVIYQTIYMISDYKIDLAVLTPAASDALFSAILRDHMTKICSKMEIAQGFERRQFFFAYLHGKKMSRKINVLKNATNLTSLNMDQSE